MSDHLMTPQEAVADLRRRFGDVEFPHNVTTLYCTPDVHEKFLDWGVIEIVRFRDDGFPVFRLHEDAEYRVLWHTAGTEKPEELRDLAAIHREKVRRGEVPPVLRGVV